MGRIQAVATAIPGGPRAIPRKRVCETTETQRHTESEERLALLSPCLCGETKAGMCKKTKG